MSDNKEKIFLFDLGNVVFSADMSRAYNGLARVLKCSSLLIESFLIESGLLFRFEKGLVTEESFFKELSQEFDAIKEYNLQQLLIEWNSIYGEYIPVTMKLLEEAKELDKSRLFALTNTNISHASCWSKKHLKLNSLFEIIYSSHEIKCRKPEKDIFSYVIEKKDLKPENILFIDDMQENIDAAIDLGINAFCFDYKSLSDQRQLKKLLKGEI